MAEFILHHYDEAPFAEKVRLMFGIKGLAWRSVIQPSAMPKPNLLPLTGGYRRTPVLQIGADVYCDTQLIASVLERLHPQPTLFPDDNPGLGYALGSWAHGPYVVSSVAIYMGGQDPFSGGLDLPQHFHEDRKKMWKTQFDTDTLGPRLPGYRTQLDAHTHFIDMQLADGRRFLTGEQPGLVDLHAMWDPWFLDRFAPNEAQRAYGRFPRIHEWLARLEAVGHGTRKEMDPAEALAIARAAQPLPYTGIAPDDPLGHRRGHARRRVADGLRGVRSHRRARRHYDRQRFDPARGSAARRDLRALPEDQLSLRAGVSVETGSSSAQR